MHMMFPRGYERIYIVGHVMCIMIGPLVVHMYNYVALDGYVYKEKVQRHGIMAL